MAAATPSPSPALPSPVPADFSADWWLHHQATLTDWALTSGFRILLIVVLFLVTTRFVHFFVERSVKLAVRPRGTQAINVLMTEKRQQTLIHLFEAVGTISLAILALVMVFHELGFAVGPLIASAGIVGVAVGFGAQSLVKDIISGSFIILESQFSVGDVIKVGDDAGAVEEINLRTTVLRDVDGGVHIIPNGAIDRVTVLTRDWSRLVLNIDVAYDADIRAASELLLRILTDYAAQHPDIVIEPPEVLGVETLGESSVQIRAWMKVLPGKQWPAGREIRATIKEAFAAAHIEIPFPQRTLWIKNESSPDPSPTP